MHIILFIKLRDYFSKEPPATTALRDWFKIAKRAEWNNFGDLRNTFNSADSIGNGRYVFNIKGNHYRIVAIVRFKFKKVLIRWVGSHKDYDLIKDIDKL